MLTVCTVNIVASDDEAALVEAGDVLDSSLSPSAFARPGSRAASTANSMWMGTEEVLRRFGVKRGAEVPAEQAALVLQGRHALTEAEVLRPRDGVVRSYELTFWAPESLAWVWVQSDEKLRA